MNKAREILRTCAIICSKKEKNILSHRIAIKLPPKCASPPQLTGPEQSMEEDLGKRKLQAIFKDEIRLRAGLDSNPILNTGALFTWNASWSMSVCHQNGYQGPRASPTHLALQLATHTARIQPSTRGQTVLDRVGG